MRDPARACFSLIEAGLLATIGLLGFPGHATAHVHVCAHTHVNQRLITCDNPGAVCGPAMHCEEIGNSSTTYCECVPDVEPPAPPPEPGCRSIGETALGADLGGLPSDGSVVTYSVAPSAADFWVLFKADDYSLIHEFGGGDVFLTGGTVTLRFGNFAPDPTQVPVEMLSLSLTSASVLIDGTSTGPNHYQLQPGLTQWLVYDSTIGLVDTVDSSGISLWVDNGLVSGLPVKLNLSAQVQPGGAIVSGQGLTFFPELLPSVSGRGLILLGGLLLLAALIVLRTRIWVHA